MKRNALLGLLLALGLSAQVQANVASTEQKIAVDTSKSQIKWLGKKLIGEGHEGTISIKSADLTMKEGKVDSGLIEIDMESIKVTDIAEDKGASKLVEHLKTKDFFETNTFKTATLKIINFKANEAANKKIAKKDSKTNKTVEHAAADLTNATYTLKGELTIKGITKEITIDKVAMKDGQFVGKFNFDRTDFNVNYNAESKKDKNIIEKAAAIAKEKMIKNDVAVEFSIATQAVSKS